MWGDCKLLNSLVSSIYCPVSATVFLPAGCHDSASVAKNQHFRHCRKTALDRKTTGSFLNCHDVLYQHAKFGGEIELRAPAVGAKIGVFLFVTLGFTARGGTYFKQVLCDSLCVDFNAVFSTFSEWIALSDALQSSHFRRSRRHNFREISVKNCEKSKNRRKRLCLCAPLLIDSWEIWRKFHCIVYGRVCRCAPIKLFFRSSLHSADSMHEKVWKFV